MKQKLFIFLIFTLQFTFSQVGGEHIYNFLNVPTSARNAALGGKVLTFKDDVNQPTWNPAMINQDMDNQLGINYVNFLADVNYGAVNFAHLISRRFGTIHGGITFVDYGKMIGADADGNETGTFKAQDIAVSFGYARQIPWESFYVGANVKWINQTIENYSSNGISADVGLVYYSDEQPFVVTAVVRNIGYQITLFDQDREKLPLAVELGFSYQLEDLPLKWYITAENLQRWKIAVSNPSDNETNIDGTTTTKDVSFLDTFTRHMIIGGELFSDKNFNLRFGYNFRRAKELRLTESRTFAGISVGFGLKLGRRMKFNYSYAKYHPVSNSSTFSLQFNLN
jgi:hypothetical protein